MDIERSPGAGRRPGTARRRGLLRVLASLAAPFLLAACASSTAGGVPAGLQIAAADGVEGCRYVTDVHGVSGAYGVFAGAGLEAARSEAMKAALAAGADTLVWRSTSTTYGQTSIHGDAYAG